MFYIAPSIIASNLTNIAKTLDLLNRAQITNLHLDVMDGSFVQAITFGSEIIKKMRPQTTIKFDVHLMVMDAAKKIGDFVEAGANLIYVHPEADIHILSTLQSIRQHNVRVGLALNPGTSLEVASQLWEHVDEVLIMSVNPGACGQKFIPNTISKIVALKNLKHNHNYKFKINVDGGVNLETIKSIRMAGADSVVAGNSFFNNLELTAEAFANRYDQLMISSQ